MKPVRRAESSTILHFRHMEGVEDELVHRRIPYLAGGRCLVNGMDCLGFVLHWFRRAGYALPDPLTCERDAVLRSQLPAHFDRVHGSPDFGDVLTFSRGGWEHIGIVTFSGILHHDQHGTQIVPFRLASPGACRRLMDISDRC